MHVLSIVQSLSLSCCRYSKINFVDLEALKEAAAIQPMEPAQFEALVKEQCTETREILSTKYVFNQHACINRNNISTIYCGIIIQLKHNSD